MVPFWETREKRKCFVKWEKVLRNREIFRKGELFSTVAKTWDVPRCGSLKVTCRKILRNRSLRKNFNDLSRKYVVGHR
jgi:hypothetical protein